MTTKQEIDRIVMFLKEQEAKSKLTAIMSIKGFCASPAVKAPVVAVAMLSIIIFFAPILSDNNPIGIDRIAEMRLGIDDISPTC